MSAPTVPAKVYRVTRAELEQLRDDGDALELENGAELRLRIVPDDTYIQDLADWGDVYGRTEWTRDSDYGPVRPADFDGTAEIMFRDHRSTLWWQPYDPTDIPGYREQGNRCEDFRKYRQLVRDILEYGFSVVGLELREQLTDSRGAVHRVVLETAWLGGIEPDPERAYVLELVTDLARELESLELETENGAAQ